MVPLTWRFAVGVQCAAEGEVRQASVQADGLAGCLRLLNSHI